MNIIKQGDIFSVKSSTLREIKEGVHLLVTDGIELALDALLWDISKFE
jgi:hypothetical protein